MNRHQLHTTLQAKHTEPVILSYADSNHYLAGAKDDDGNFFLLEEKGKTCTFDSVAQAANALADLGVEEANLIMQTAYDEMIGRDSVGASFDHHKVQVKHFA